MKRKISIKTQVILSLVLFVILVLGLIFGFQSTFMDDIYKANKIKSLKTAGNEIAQNLENEDFDSLINSTSYDKDVCVSIITNDNTYLDFSRKNACVLSNLTNAQVNEIAIQTSNNGGNKLFDNFKLVGADRNDLYIYSVLTSYKNEPLMVLSSTIVTPIIAVTSTLSSMYLIIAVIVIAATIIFSFVLSKVFLKPLNKITKESKLLPYGKYDGNTIKTINLETDELNKTLIEANGEIQKADKAKKELIANVSHDLRTPLTMIIGYGEMIRDMPDESDSENAAIIVEEAKRLTSLVNDLLDVSKDNELKIIKEDIELNEMLDNVFNQYEKYFESLNVKFNLIKDDDIHFIGDEKRIKQVLYNFINNAYSYNNKQDKEISLGVEKIENKYRVYVLDNGEGIKGEDLSKVWDRYFKVDTEHKRSELGSGIGLSLSKNILEAHNYNYGVNSRIGKYSKFYFDVEAI